MTDILRNDSPFPYANPSDTHQTLVDLLDRVLDVGIVVKGDLTISVADVDLIYVGLKLIACTPDKIPGLVKTPATNEAAL